MARFKLQAEIVPNPDIRLYHTNFGMCGTDQSFYMVLEGKLERHEEQFRELPEHSKTLISGVLGIIGVVRLSLKPYQLHVEKAPLFDWSEIEPQIIGLIQVIGAEIVRENIEHIQTPIREMAKWGCREDGTPIPSPS